MTKKSKSPKMHSCFVFRFCNFFLAMRSDASQIALDFTKQTLFGCSGQGEMIQNKNKNSVKSSKV